MSPISATLPPVATYGLRPALDVVTPELTPGVQGLAPLKEPSEINATQPAGESFSSVLGRMVEEVSAQQGAANNAVAALQSGQNVSLHQAVIAMEEANLSFQLMVEVRNKLLDSYQELMRMQV